jgi:hypothetical protein
MVAVTLLNAAPGVHFGSGYAPEILHDPVCKTEDVDCWVGKTGCGDAR